MVADESSRTAQARVGVWGGAPHASMLRCAYAALAAARCDLAACRVYVGWQLNLDVEPELVVQRSRGATFDWVAIGWSPVRMFDLHAGVVYQEPDVFVGLHAHARLGTGWAITQALAGEDVIHRYSPTVDEQQYNYPGEPATAADWDRLHRQLTHCIELLPGLSQEVCRAES